MYRMIVALLITGILMGKAHAGGMIGGGNNIGEGEKFSTSELIKVLKEDSLFVGLQYLNLLAQRIPRDESAPFYISALKQKMRLQFPGLYQKLEVHLVMGQGKACVDPVDGSQKDGTALVVKDGDYIQKFILCFAVESIRSKVSKEDYQDVLYPFLVHELSHLAGFDEEGAEYFESMARRYFRQNSHLNFGKIAIDNIQATTDKFQDGVKLLTQIVVDKHLTQKQLEQVIALTSIPDPQDSFSPLLQRLFVADPWQFEKWVYQMGYWWNLRGLNYPPVSIDGSLDAGSLASIKTTQKFLESMLKDLSLLQNVSVVQLSQ